MTTSKTANYYPNCITCEGCKHVIKQSSGSKNDLLYSCSIEVKLKSLSCTQKEQYKTKHSER